MNWGDLPNQSFEDFLKDWEYASQNKEFKPKFGSSVTETAKRLGNIMGKLAKAYENGNILLITHGGTIRDFLVMLSEKYKSLFSKEKWRELENALLQKLFIAKKKLLSNTLTVWIT